MNKNIKIIDLGLIDYKEAWDYQEEIFAGVIRQKIENRECSNPMPTDNFLLICEHPHVFTLGKSGKESNLLINELELKRKNAAFYKINRGGDITYHGPGQLVVYPILDLDNFFTDIHRYLRSLEEAVIRTLSDFQIDAGRYPNFTGVWVEPESPKARKICAMGVKCSRWVTMHGLALNINSNLDYFKYIVPCGIDDKAVTSMEFERNKRFNFQAVKVNLIQKLSSIFDFTEIGEVDIKTMKIDDWT